MSASRTIIRTSVRTSILGAATLCLASPVGGRVEAQPAARVPHVRVSLVSESSTFVPGTPFTVAVVFEIDPTWHTYYVDPGDSGMAAEVKWTLPEGLTAGPLQFPKPQVLKTLAGVNFVYTDKVALLVEIKPSADLKVGRALAIKADVKWLECDDERCVPGKASAAASVEADDRVASVDKDQFEAWRKAVKDAETFDAAAARKSAVGSQQ